MEKTFEQKLAEVGDFLKENGPGALRGLAFLLRLFPAKTLAFKLGDLLSHFVG